MKRFASVLLLLAGLPLSAVASTTWFVDARNGSNGYSGLSPRALLGDVEPVNLRHDDPRLVRGIRLRCQYQISRHARMVNSRLADALESDDGLPWTPALTVKGGNSGFYRIKVGK